ncbi:MAG TPA: tRNA (guanosine(37)-N1)-methyltransferase TrmD [Gaiellales bacterium]|jgi:tRNA (guanine37-N1)-methyltransferase|nr:tRNA (guanosine(37)-N1)-methyltransferase TrmD [Gaiellales bacterium]
MLEIDVFTLFPEAFSWLAGTRPLRNATEAGSLRLSVVDLRDWSIGSYRQVDDAPYGGGAGMLIRVDVVCAALEGRYAAGIEEVLRDRRVAVLAPVGRQLTDAVAAELAGCGRLTLLCGRYEGFDQRVHDHLANDQLSIGPFVLSGGEIPAMTVIDAVCRKLPGALGKEESHLVESFSPQLDGGLEYPHYTRPEEFRGWRVPDVLLSGHHAEIERWRLEQSRARSR